MGANLYVKFEHEIPSVDPNGSDRVFLCKYQEELDGLAKILGVKPLSAFFSYSEEDFDEMGMDSPGEIEAQWFLASEIESTLTALESGLYQRAGLQRKDAVRADLLEMKALAASAVRNSTKMRLYIGF